MKKVVWGVLILLAVIHQDVWFWDDATLIFGFVPIGLLFHLAISIAAGVTWWMATRYCWPNLIEDASQSDEGGVPS